MGCLPTPHFTPTQPVDHFGEESLKWSWEKWVPFRTPPCLFTADQTFKDKVKLQNFFNSQSKRVRFPLKYFYFFSRVLCLTLAFGAGGGDQSENERKNRGGKSLRLECRVHLVGAKRIPCLNTLLISTLFRNAPPQHHHRSDDFGC